MPESVAALARRGVEHVFRKGTLLIREGDFGDTLYVVLAGRLRVFGSNPANGREITYGIYGPGEYVGEMGLDGGPRAASVIALVTTRCAVVARPTLEAHIAANPGFAFELLAKVISRARAATLTAKQLALNDVYGRLRALYESLAEPDAEGRRVIPRPPTRQEVADRIGCTPKMVGLVLKTLREGGWVQLREDGALVVRALPLRW
jgi:CRP/FNR family cyclic AMP-dependent transcriptional regulator